MAYTIEWERGNYGKVYYPKGGSGHWISLVEDAYTFESKEEAELVCVGLFNKCHGLKFRVIEVSPPKKYKEIPLEQLKEAPEEVSEEFGVPLEVEPMFHHVVNLPYEFSIDEPLQAQTVYLLCALSKHKAVHWEPDDGEEDYTTFFQLSLISKRYGYFQVVGNPEGHQVYLIDMEVHKV